VEQFLALLVRHLLRVVEPGERTNAGPTERLVVEEYACDDQGAGQRPATRLVGTRDVPYAEAPVVGEEPLAARASHAVENRP
jgi:hypothetical protein